jgi:hypothetical protein
VRNGFSAEGCKLTREVSKHWSYNGFSLSGDSCLRGGRTGVPPNGHLAENTGKKP